MAYLFDGGFTGFLYSMRETGRKLKDGAKELVEDFVSGFNGHGWKLWKRNDSWRLEVDELLVRKSLTTFEMIISQITSIKGSQAITQGNGKIKSVTLVDSADVYKETDEYIYSTNFNNWIKGDSAISTSIKVEFNGNSSKAYIQTTRACDSFKFKVLGLGEKEKITIFYNEDGEYKEIEIKTDGDYQSPIFTETDIVRQNVFKITTDDESGIIGFVSITQEPLRLDITETVVQEPCYRIELENEQNTFTEYDLIRCQKGDKFYYVQVGSIFQYYVNIPISEFETNDEGIVVNSPKVGDELVQFGNVSHQEKYNNRHSAIYMHLDDNEPAIDLMTDIHSKDWSKGNIIKTRIGGNLPGTNGDRGFYCVNGKILSVDENGETVYVINPDGSASFARGRLSWAKNGSPKFSGTILLTLSNNNIWEVTEDGLNLIGDKNGKHIEINTNTSDIKIFSSDNKVSTIFEGNYYYTLEELFETSHTDIILKNIPASYKYSSSDLMPVSIDISNVFYTSSYAAIYYTANLQINNQPSTSIESSIAVKLYTYSDRELTNLTSESILRKFVYNRQGYESSIIYQEEESIIANGYHIVRVEFNSISNSILALAAFNIRLSLTGYLSKYYSNGLSLGSSIDNVASFYNDAYDNINSLITNSKYGIKITNERLLSRSNGLWGMIPSILCVGRVSGDSDSYKYLSYRTFDNSVMPANIRRNGIGWVTISFPTSWQKYSIDYSNAYVMLTGIGTAWDESAHSWTEAPIKATFRTWISNPAGFDVLLSDDASRNDGDFMFEVKLLQ